MADQQPLGVWHFDCSEAVRRDWRASGTTAVIAYDDPIALGLMARLAEHRLQVGRDIIVIGIDDSPMSDVAYPTLTSIHVPGAEAGGVAVDLLLDQLEDADADSATASSWTPAWVIRASTGPAPPDRDSSPNSGRLLIAFWNNRHSARRYIITSITQAFA